MNEVMSSTENSIQKIKQDGKEMFVMPQNWKPGDKVSIPDPNNPGRMIEVPFEALDIQAVPAPNIGAEVGNDTSNMVHAKKGKKKKKKRLVNSII